MTNTFIGSGKRTSEYLNKCEHCEAFKTKLFAVVGIQLAMLLNTGGNIKDNWSNEYYRNMLLNLWRDRF